jgi:hypothetical protein
MTVMDSVTPAGVRELSEDEIQAVIGGCKSPGPIVVLPGPISTGPALPRPIGTGPAY